jgi:hypothetical protein
MPFGLGAFETLLVLAIVVGIPVALAVLLVRAARRSGDRPADPGAGRRRAAELDSTRQRLDEMEAKLARTEEKAAFTESLLDDRRKGS